MEPKRPATSTKKEKKDGKAESNKIENEKREEENKIIETTKQPLDTLSKSLTENKGIMLCINQLSLK